MKPPIEVSILMPCLNEAETIGRCVDRACEVIAQLNLRAEVLVVDNGSTDSSSEIALAHGAKVVMVEEPGYGAAIRGGVAASAGRYIIMGDADESYDFGELPPIIERLRAGDDLVMGNRFAGSIDKGAMPWSHRWIGNPVLSMTGRLSSPRACGISTVAYEGSALRHSPGCASTQPAWSSQARSW